MIRIVSEIVQVARAMNDAVEPLAAADHLRIVVLDHTTGNIGSLQIPMKKR